MAEDESTKLRHAVEVQQGDRGVWSSAEPVKETVNRKTALQGVVHVFNLDGYPGATMAYAWSLPIGRNKRRKFFVALHLGDIRSLLDAVRAAVSEHRAEA